MRSHKGHVGIRVPVPTKHPWDFCSSAPKHLHVHSDPLEALAWMTLEAQRYGNSRSFQDMHVMAMCGREPSILYAYLADHMDVEHITLHMEDEDLHQELRLSLHSCIQVCVDGFPQPYGSWVEMLREQRNNQCASEVSNTPASAEPD